LLSEDDDDDGEERDNDDDYEPTMSPTREVMRDEPGRSLRGRNSDAGEGIMTAVVQKDVGVRYQRT